MSTFVFIDTNILLDFYRIRGQGSDLSLLHHLDGNHGSVITSSQVEMEFKKNRPAVILGSYRELKAPEWKGSGGLPAFLAQSKQSTALSGSRKRVDTLLKALRVRTERILKAPKRYDTVYRVSQRLFRSKSPTNLSREMDSRYRIRRLAAKRFILGYPPRKQEDTSIGDAINWEWIVRCAMDANANVVLVTRDSDYGIDFDGAPVLNDWLGQEFKERVGRRRTITLTARLAEALRIAGIKVSKKEEHVEEAFLATRADTPAPQIINLGFGPLTGGGNVPRRGRIGGRAIQLTPTWRGLFDELENPRETGDERTGGVD